MLIASTLALAACGGSSSSNETLAPLPTASTVPPETSVATTSTSTTTTTTPTTTTSIPDGSSLVLRSDSLGDARFGVEPSSVISYVESVLGPADDDSGWTDPFSVFGTCPGTEVRGVRWGDLLLLFGDDSEFDTGRRHFFHWQVGPTLGVTPSPTGLATDGGIGVGSTVDELTRVHPEAEIFDDAVFGPGFEIERGLFGTLTEIGDDATVLTLFGGTSCGE